jgi:hypothetical protein
MHITNNIHKIKGEILNDPENENPRLTSSHRPFDINVKNRTSQPKNSNKNKSRIIAMPVEFYCHKTSIFYLIKINLKRKYIPIIKYRKHSQKQTE